ncbi:beta-N-acetylhexosaminidase [Caulobacter endophyticus]|nr:family 20 glycosylhydrolase [Caulobacter endophyticus]
MRPFPPFRTVSPRRRTLPLVGLLALSALPAIAAPTLMPQPRQTNWSQGVLPIDGAFAVSWKDCGDPRLPAAARRLQDDVLSLTGMALTGRQGPSLAVSCRRSPRGGDPRAEEAYRLTVAADGVRLEAGGALGVLRGLATLRQLVETKPPGATLAYATIDDAPRFAWRGLMIDTVRHFVTLDTIKRQIDAMERVKLNVLHLHLSDNEGFRVESRRYPKLQTAGDGQFYTQDQVRELVTYAAERGVRIVPEFDVPGHGGAIAQTYPEFTLAQPKPANAFAALDRALDPTREETYRFLDRLLGEMAALFPDAYFHVGGDEVSDAVWLDHPHVQAFMKAQGLASKQALEARFHQRVAAIMRKHGKTMIGWEEVAVTGTVPKDVVVQAWQTSNATAHAVKAGHRTIVSAGYYLDLLEPAAFHYQYDPLDTGAAGLTPAEAEMGRKLSPLMAAVLTDALVAKPLPPLTPDEEALVLGGEAALWGETLSDEMIDKALWPRAAAMAERFWSPREIRDTADLYRRLPMVQDQLRLQGLQDGAVQARMAARLAPGDTEAVMTLLDLVGPTRNMAHNHRILAALRGQKIVQELNGLADAAPVDSLVARRFEARARAYAAGDRGEAAALRADLQTWRANHARFQAVAKGRPALEAALPISTDIAALATAGLQAMDAAETGKPLSQEDLAAAEAVLTRVTAFEAASARPLFSFLGKQPPADLIIKISPGVRALLTAAR